MNSTPENKSSGFNAIVACFGYLVLFASVLCAGWLIGNSQIEKIVNSKQAKVSDAIIKTINEQAQLDLFIPQVVFINVDSIHKKHLNDSIKKQISSVLIERYSSYDKLSPGKLSFQPFFIYPDSADKKGNYTLTKVQLEELKNHILFLSQKVDNAVTVIKDEMGREIDRLNTWVSIWIGVIGFLGIFIPIVINVKSAEELKDISKKAEYSKRMVEKVNSVIKVATENAAMALSKAVKTEKLVTALNDLSKIKDIDANYLIHNPDPLLSLKTYLSEIQLSLTNGVDLHDVPMMRDILRQLGVRLHLIAPYNFIAPANFILLNQFAIDISVLVAQPLTQQSYNEAVTLLDTLNNNLV